MFLFRFYVKLLDKSKEFGKIVKKLGPTLFHRRHKLMNLIVKLVTKFFLVYFHIWREAGEKEPASRFHQTKNLIECNQNVVVGE